MKSGLNNRGLTLSVKAMFSKRLFWYGYNISNTKLIKWLDISDEEQTHLKTIIDGSEKRRRKTIVNREKGRSKGVQKREDYIKEQHNKTDDKLLKLKQLLEANPKVKKTELAKLLGVGRTRLYQLIKEL